MPWLFSSAAPTLPLRESPPQTSALPPQPTSPDQVSHGTLVVIVLKARHLLTASSSRWTKQSPYVCLTLYTASEPTAVPEDVTSIASNTTERTNVRKRSKDSSRERRTSLVSVPPLERADTVEKARAKLEKERAKSISQALLVPTPELDFKPEAEFDHRAALCTPVDPRGGQHPSWDAELRFPLTVAEDDGRRKLNVEMWAKVGLGRRDKPLGSAQLDVEDAILKGAMDGMFASKTYIISQTDQNAQCGSLCLSTA